MKAKRYGYRELVTALLLLLVAVSLFFAWRAFRQESSQHEAELRAQGEEGGALVVDELAASLALPKAVDGRYQIIEEKNLFSPERKAWQAPPAAPAGTEPEQKIMPPSSLAKGEIVYYGSYTKGDLKYAILGFKKLRIQRGKVILAEGETAKDEQGAALWYTLRKVTPLAAVLENNQGQIYTVGLFDHESRNPKQTKNTTEIKVAASEPPKAVATVVETAAAKEDAKKKEAEANPYTTSSLAKMPEGEKEALVQAGKLKKVNTPMGVIYQPVK